uniref:Uncharacterized protein n=1 Tax=viral metagenome TaxID=1070528 RepID=A0A6C0M1Q1_9ZZZZ
MFFLVILVLDLELDLDLDLVLGFLDMGKQKMNVPLLVDIYSL